MRKYYAVETILILQFGKAMGACTTQHYCNVKKLPRNVLLKAQLKRLCFGFEKDTMGFEVCAAALITKNIRELGVFEQMKIGLILNEGK